MIKMVTGFSAFLIFAAICSTFVAAKPFPYLHASELERLSSNDLFKRENSSPNLDSTCSVVYGSKPVNGSLTASLTKAGDSWAQAFFGPLDGTICSVSIRASAPKVATLTASIFNNTAQGGIIAGLTEPIASVNSTTKSSNTVEFVFCGEGSVPIDFGSTVILVISHADNDDTPVTLSFEEGLAYGVFFGPSFDFSNAVVSQGLDFNITVSHNIEKVSCVAPSSQTSSSITSSASLPTLSTTTVSCNPSTVTTTKTETIFVYAIKSTTTIVDTQHLTISSYVSTTTAIATTTAFSTKTSTVVATETSTKIATQTSTAVTTKTSTSDAPSATGPASCGAYDGETAFESCNTMLTYANCVNSLYLKVCYTNSCTSGADNIQACSDFWQAAIKASGGKTPSI